MTTPSNRLDFEVKDDARLALDERLRTGTRRSTRPAWARLEAWRSAGGAALEVNFVGDGASHGRVGPVLVIPVEESSDFAPQRTLQQRDGREQARAAIFEGADEALGDRNASCLTDGALAMSNAVLLTPGLELSAGELSAGIGDEVFGRCADCGDEAAKEVADLLRGRLLFENGVAEGSARKVVHDDGDPPAERPALW